MPGWQTFYEQLKDKNFEILSIAQDTGGVKDAGPWITKANPTYTALVDSEHLVTKLYNLVNVPTGIWINENGKLVRPPEVAFIDDRFKPFSGLESAPYLDGIRDWVTNGEKSEYVFAEKDLKAKMTPATPEHTMAATEFSLAEYLVHIGSADDAIPHFKEAQRLYPENWNYKRQAYLLADSKKNYGTTFQDEVKALNGKPYYPPPDLPAKKKDKDKPKSRD